MPRSLPNPRIARSRSLRRAETEPEWALWSDLRDRRLHGFKFGRQVVIDRYTVDFACKARRLVVEVDGSQHADSVSDRVRDERPATLGRRVLRFWNDEVMREREWVLERIVGVLEGQE